MAYQIRTNGSQHEVVLTINGGKTVVRVLNSYASRSDAEQLLTDLSGWRF